jgi:hypothetical protein
MPVKSQMSLLIYMINGASFFVIGMSDAEAASPNLSGRGNLIGPHRDCFVTTLLAMTE